MAKVLIGCEQSGVVRDAFVRQGHDAWSCDVLAAETPSNRHIQDDVRNVLAQEKWDLLIIAHPPCTRLCNSGVRWLHKAPPGKTLEQMWRELDEGAELFSDMWNADCPRIAVENPVMHKYAKERIRNYEPFAQSFQPWQFAKSDDASDNVKKRTCLWLRNLPDLVATGQCDGTTARDEIHKAPPGPDRWKFRSRFFNGVADAMAQQWGGLL
jgi:hypothetical protein